MLHMILIDLNNETSFYTIHLFINRYKKHYLLTPAKKSKL